MDDTSHRDRAVRATQWTCYVVLSAVLLYVLIARVARPLYIDDLGVVRGSRTTSASLPADPGPLKVNPNTAGLEELTSLPGIGEKLAARIIEHRRGHSGPGPAFRTAEDLDEVPGLGPKMIEKLRPLLTFDPLPKPATPPAALP